MKLNLPARKPFNFQSVVNSHGWVQLAPFHFEKDFLYYVDHLSTGRVVEYRISASSDGVQMETDKLSKSEQNEVTDKVTWMFGLDMDFSRFHAASRAEPKLARAKKQALGRVLRSPTLFEDVIKTILTTNTLWAATINMTRKLVDEFGASTTGREKLDTPLSAMANNKAFPTPESIAASNPETIKEKIRVGYRAPAIHELAVRVASGKYDLESLKTFSLPHLNYAKS